MKYKRSYRYDPVFALGFVTVYDKLMEGYPSDEDRDAIFQAYIKALKEDPQEYRLQHCVVLVFFICFVTPVPKSLAEMEALISVSFLMICIGLSFLSGFYKDQ